MNKYLEIKKDLLPDGSPNSAWRRLLLRIQNTWSLTQLAALYSRYCHKSVVFQDRHRVALFHRIPNLVYYR